MGNIIRENEFGLLECLNDCTGEVIWKQLPSKSMLKRLAAGKPLRMKNKPDPRTIGGRPSAFSFSSYFASIIITKVLEGYSIIAISRLESMPPVSTIYYWAKRYKDFGNLLNQARKVRAEIIFEKILDIAENGINQKNHQEIKLKLETLKWTFENNI